MSPPSPSPRLRRALVALAVLAVALAATYLLWLRDSSLVRVEKTTVTGLTTAQAGKIRTLLTESARGMTTLHVDEEELERAVASYPAVAAVETEADLPHGLAIEVVERPPIAAVEGPAGEEVPVAADATLLPDFEPRRPLPRLPAAVDSASGWLEDEAGLVALEAVTAAPPALAERIDGVVRDDGGLVVMLDGGPRVLLGDDDGLEAKWAAAAAALAQGGAAGAEYLDVSMPERPAAGGAETGIVAGQATLDQ